MPTIKKKPGFSLVEAILSVALFSMIVSAFTGAILYGEQTTAFSGARMRASLLAEEGLEAVRNIRDENFANLVDGRYGLGVAGNQWAFSGTEDVTDIFTRQITISTVDDNAKNIISTVNWEQSENYPVSVSLATVLTNWHAPFSLGIGLTVNSIVINHGGTKIAADFGPYLVGDTYVQLDTPASFDPGTYAVTETPDPNYTQTFSGDCSYSGEVTLEDGDSKICTITNEEKLAYITVNKTVINHGSSKVSSDFAPFKVGTAEVTAGAQTAVDSGTYAVTETTDPNYTQTFGGDCSSSGEVTLAPGDNKVCTITNEEVLTHVTVNKTVINHGGSKTAADFEPYKVGTTGVTVSVPAMIDFGTYAVTETTDPNYTQTFGGDCSTSGSISLAPGDSKVCTITNEEKLAYVTINKTIVNHGGSKVALDFAPYKVGTTAVTLGTPTVMNSGTYTVSETVDPNYTQTFGGDCSTSGSISLAPGDSKVCTITNEEIPSQITVNKTIINHGGSKVAADFAPYKVGTATVTAGVPTAIDSGTYTVSETVDPNYTQTFSGDCSSSGSITIAAGDNKVCTITNEEILSHITVNKTVINHGGSKAALDFAPYKVDSTTVSLGASTVMNSGTYTVSETVDPNYTQTFGGDCSSSGSVTLTPGTTKVCTITNEEKLAYVTVNKTVINHGGSKVTADFAPYKVDSTTVSLGASTVMNSGTYTVSETTDPNYIETFSNDCSSSGSVTLTPGTTKVCTITNEEILPANGILIYGDGTNTPKYRDYNGYTNAFSVQKSTITATVAPTWLIRTAPTSHYALAGYYDSTSTLTIMCFNGTTWDKEFAAQSGGIGNRHRFDIAFEKNSGDAMIIYSKGTYANAKLGYRTKSGSTGCGPANWSGETIFTPARTSNDIMYVKMASDPRPSSNIIAATWVDINDDISAAIWNGTAWVNEPSAVTDTNLEIVSASHDIEDMDLDYESLSGDLMLVWANGAGNNGTNGVRYRTCTGGTAACTWNAVTTPPTFLDSATSLDISANPDTNEIVFASIGRAGSDLQLGYWDGSAWTDTANADTSCSTPFQASKIVSTGWVVSGTTSRSVVVYGDQGSSDVNWYTGDGGVFTKQADFAASPGVTSPQGYMDINMNPLAENQLMYATSDSAGDLFAKRLTFTAPSAFTWTNSDGSALGTTLPQIISSPFSFAFWRN